MLTMSQSPTDPKWSDLKLGPISVWPAESHLIMRAGKGKLRKSRSAPSLSEVCPWRVSQLNLLITLLMSSARGPGSPISFIRPTLSRAAWRGTDKWNGQRNLFTTLKFLPVEQISWMRSSKHMIPCWPTERYDRLQNHLEPKHTPSRVKSHNTTYSCSTAETLTKVLKITQ